MTRYSADACGRGNLPGWPLEFVYVDGACQGTVAAGQRTISSLAQALADVGDVEPGNPWWPTWIPWVVRCRAAGRDPYLYCCDDGYGSNSVWNGWRHADGVQAFAAYGVRPPHWWVFNDNLSEPPPYALMVQFAQNVSPGYDISACADYLPGIDPQPPTPIVVEDDGMPAPFLATGDSSKADPHGQGAVYLVSNWPYGPKRYVTNQAALTNYTDGLKMAIQTVPQFVLDRCESEPDIVSGSYPSEP